MFWNIVNCVLFSFSILCKLFSYFFHFYNFFQASTTTSQHQWCSQPKNLFGGNMFDFRRTTLFCLEKRLLKHKRTICSKNLGKHGPPGYAYERHLFWSGACLGWLDLCVMLQLIRLDLCLSNQVTLSVHLICWSEILHRCVFTRALLPIILLSVLTVSKCDTIFFWSNWACV